MVFFFFSQAIKEARSSNGFVVGLGWWFGIKGKRNKQGRKKKKKRDQRRRGVLYEERNYYFFLETKGEEKSGTKRERKKGKETNKPRDRRTLVRRVIKKKGN